MFTEGAVLWTLKVGSSSGFAAGSLNLVWQTMRNACRRSECGQDKDPEGVAEGEEELERELTGSAPSSHRTPRAPPLLVLSVQDAIDAFTVGAMLGAAGGAIGWRFMGDPKAFHAAGEAVRALVVGEAVWLPLAVWSCAGETGYIEDALPAMFASTNVLLGVSLLTLRGVSHYKLLARGTLGTINAVQLSTGLWYVGAPACGFTLLLFSWKFGELSRGKELLWDLPRVRRICTAANATGQTLATICAVDAVALPWLGAEFVTQPWVVPAMIITPLFLYCTALNIENGVSSRELTTAMSLENPADVQQRRSTMQVLPTGLLPYAWTKGIKTIPVALKLCFGAFALACASMYIACQIVPWRAFLKRDRLLLRQQSSQDVGFVARAAGTDMRGRAGSLAGRMGPSTMVPEFIQEAVVGYKMTPRDQPSTAAQAEPEPQSTAAARRASLELGAFDDEL